MDEAQEDSNASEEPPAEVIVEAASDAAEDVVFSRLSVDDVRDFDITVTYDTGVLEVDVYLHAPNVSTDSAAIADDAALAAQQAVDELLT